MRGVKLVEDPETGELIAVADTKSFNWYSG